MGIMDLPDGQGPAFAGITSSPAGTFALQVTQHSLVAGKALHAQQRRLRRGLRSDNRLNLRTFSTGLIFNLHVSFITGYFFRFQSSKSPDLLISNFPPFNILTSGVISPLRTMVRARSCRQSHIAIGSETL